MTDFEQRVRERAYYIWEDEGRVFGCADAHWLRAETELQARVQVEPILVQASPPALTLAASPAEVLKAKRTRAATAKVDAKVATTKAAKAPAKSVAKSVEKTATPKVAASKTASAKAAAPKAEAKASKAPRAVARARTAEMAATVH